MEAERKGSQRNVPHHTSDVFARSARLPEEADLQRAAEVLHTGKKIAILAGRGALGAADELEQVAEKLGAPIGRHCSVRPWCRTIASTPRVSSAFWAPDPHRRSLRSATTPCGRHFLPLYRIPPKPGQARAVQIELDPMRIGLRYPVEVGLVGDSRRSLKP